MELVSNLPKPPGFFDPEGAGRIGRRRPNGRPARRPSRRRDPNAAAPPPGGSGFTNSDLAFKGMHAVVGNYHGFNTYDIENAQPPKLVASIVCPGGQGDVSIYGNLLFMSVEQTRGRLDCGVQGVTTPVSVERFRGIRIFDITEPEEPQAGGGHPDLPRLAHAHAGARSSATRHASTSTARAPATCARARNWPAARVSKPKEDPNTALFSIDVIKVPLKNPEKAAIVNRPRIFADADDRRLAGLWQGGNHGEGTQTHQRRPTSATTSRCTRTSGSPPAPARATAS